MRPNKDRLYSSEGQMGILFMVSPYTLRGAPLGPFKAEEVCICVCVHTLFFPPGSSTHLGQPLVPDISTLSLLAVTNTLHKGLGCVCVCWISLCSVIFIALSYLLSQKSSAARRLYALLFPHGSYFVHCSDCAGSRCSACQCRGHSSVALVGKELTGCS